MSKPKIDSGTTSIVVGDDECNHMMIRRLTNKELKNMAVGALKPVFVCEYCDGVFFLYAPPNGKVTKLSDS